MHRQLNRIENPTERDKKNEWTNEWLLMMKERTTPNGFFFFIVLSSYHREENDDASTQQKWEEFFSDGLYTLGYDESWA